MIFRSVFLVFCLLLSACTNFLFVPIKPLPVTPDAAEIEYDDIYLDTADGKRLHGWKLHADGSWQEKGKLGKHRPNQKSAGTILFFHGNGDNVSTQLPNTFWLVKEGYDLYVFDYREYGLSQGEAELDSTIDDMALMMKYTIDQLAKNEKLIVIGHSLGGAMAIYAVAHSEYKNRIEALITIEAFSDYHDVTQDVLSKSWLFWLFQWPLSFTVDNSYRPLDSIGLISPVPVAIIHSKSDEMIPMYHAERLFAAAKQPKTFLQINSNHSNILLSKENRQVLFDYLKTLRK